MLFRSLLAVGLSGAFALSCPALAAESLPVLVIHGQQFEPGELALCRHQAEARYSQPGSPPSRVREFRPFPRGTCAGKWRSNHLRGASGTRALPIL